MKKTRENILKEILQLSEELISIESVSGNSTALEVLLGIAVKNLNEFTVEKFEQNGVQSVLVYNTQNRPKRFKVILNGHLDVIPGRDDQYKPKISGNKLYGVGAMDMKSSVACLILTFKSIAKKVDFPLALQLTTDEQSGSLNGTKFQIDQGVRSDFVIAGETTNFNVVNQAKGVLWVKVSIQGKSAHSAYPWQGENSIWIMNKFLNKLKEEFPDPVSETWKTTVGVSRVETRNLSFNKIPDEGEVWLDVRYIPEDKDVIKRRLRTLLPKGCGMKIFFEEAPLFVSENNKYLKALQRSAAEILKRDISVQSAHGTSDTTHYAKVGCPAVEFGPIGQMGNTSKEYVEIASLKDYFQILSRFLLNIKTI